jgi:riboflavin synthase alpha subunit
VCAQGDEGGDWAQTYRPLLVPKGWIAVDGVSLTVVAVEAERFSVCLIPETLARTTLGSKDKGDPVHLEFDGTAKVRTERKRERDDYDSVNQKKRERVCVCVCVCVCAYV